MYCGVLLLMLKLIIIDFKDEYPYFLLNIRCHTCINRDKRTSLACAARLADTKCPPEAPFGRL